MYLKNFAWTKFRKDEEEEGGSYAKYPCKYTQTWDAKFNRPNF